MLIVKLTLSLSHSYHVATGGDDNTVNVWDLRRKSKLYTIAAHSNLVSQLKFQRELILLYRNDD